MADRKEANFSQGWGIAALVTLMAIGAFVGAGALKAKTYGHPRDPLTPSAGAPEGGHGSAAAAGHGEAASAPAEHPAGDSTAKH